MNRDALTDRLELLLPRVELLLSEVVRMFAYDLSGDVMAYRSKGNEDVVTVLDERANSMLSDGLFELLPGVYVDSEEMQRPDLAGKCRWVVDPLDGSQNIAFGIPLFGACVCLLCDDSVILAVAAEVWSGRILGACEGVPARVRRLEAGRLTDVVRVTGTRVVPGGTCPRRLALIRGSRRLYSEDLSKDFMSALVVLTVRYDRVYQTRSPVVDLFMLESGGSRAMVCVGMDGYETPAVLYLAKLLGLEVHEASDVRTGPWNLASRVIVARSAHVKELLRDLSW